jgi:hypothetical protein
MGDAVLMELTSPQRFREGSGPQWQGYAEALNILDGVWRDRRVQNTSFGVVGPRPSWEDTIARGGVLFALESWARLGACPCNRNRETKESKIRPLREIVAPMAPIRFQMFQILTFRLNTGTHS